MKEKIEKQTQGRAGFIHNLRSDGVGKAEALKKAQTKFVCSKSLFERIWKRGERGAKEAPAKKSKATKSA